MTMRMRMSSAPGGYVWRTLSIVAAGNEDVDKTRDNELTDVSPELVGSTPPNDCCRLGGGCYIASSAGGDLGT